jgi:hypothetical protein
MRRAIAVVVGVASTLSTILIGVDVALAAPPAVPMVGERFLTPAERAAAVEGMTPQESGSIGHLFAEDAPGLVVAYARREFAVTPTPDGGQTIEPVGVVADSPTGVLSVPSHAVAGTTSGTRRDTNLFISLTIVKTRSVSPYEWQVYEWAQWGTKGSYWPAGMNCCNNHEDSIGVAWAGGLALHSDTESGIYQAWCMGEPALDIRRSGVSNNLGVGHSFHEWWDPDNCPMYWAQVDNRIRETTWKNRLSNVTMKYFHTWGGFDYRLGFSATGPNLTISPTNETWVVDVYLSFTH